MNQTQTLILCILKQKETVYKWYFSDYTTFLYHRLQIKIANQAQALIYASKDYQKLFGSDFLVIAQLSCIIVHLSNHYANQV